MGKWHRVDLYPMSNHPCSGCQAGWGSQSHKVVAGVNYFKTDTCNETCERLKNYTYQREEDLIQGALARGRKEHLFGDNIREAYHAIKGS